MLPVSVASRGRGEIPLHALWGGGGREGGKEGRKEDLAGGGGWLHFFGDFEM